MNAKDVKPAKEATGKVRWAALFVRLILAAIFVWAAVPKLMDPSAFAEAVANYHLVPDSLVGAVAVVVPALELVVAIALVVGMGARGAAIVAGLMLVGFTIGMVQAMARGIDLDCGCFGTATKVEVGWGSIARNVALLGLAVSIAVMPDAKWRGGGPKAGAAVTAALPMLLAVWLAGCGGEASAPRQLTTIEPLGLAIALPPGHEISGTRVTFEPGARSPRTLEIRRISSDAAERLLEEGYSAQARIAGGTTSLVYRVQHPEDVGSGGPEVHLTGVFRLCQGAYRVECHAQGEPPPDGAWCVRILETISMECGEPG